MKPQTQPHVVIIGGGLAGGAAAILLTRAGYAVTLFEKEADASHKVCGEFISIEAQQYLARLGLDRLALQQLGAVPLGRLNLGCGTRYATLALPFMALSLSRRTLDAAVLAQAKAAGANVRCGEAVKFLTQDGADWIVATATAHVNAATVLLACGKHDLRGWSRATAADNSRLQDDLIGLKMYYRVPAAVEHQLLGQTWLQLFPGGYAGIEPVEAGLINLCLVVRKQVFAALGKDWNRLLQKLATTNTSVAALLQEATPLWPKPLAIYGIPYGFMADPAQSLPGLYRLGDQLAVIPSLCGDGMAIALHSAFAAAASLQRGQDSRNFHKAMHKQLRPQIRQAMRLSRLAVSPLWQWTLPLIARVSPRLIRRFIQATRIQAYL